MRVRFALVCLVSALAGAAVAGQVATGSYDSTGLTTGSANSLGTAGVMDTVSPPYGHDNFAYVSQFDEYRVLDGDSGQIVAEFTASAGPPYTITWYSYPQGLVLGTSTWTSK